MWKTIAALEAIVITVFVAASAFASQQTTVLQPGDSIVVQAATVPAGSQTIRPPLAGFGDTILQPGSKITVWAAQLASSPQPTATTAPRTPSTATPTPSSGSGSAKPLPANGVISAPGTYSGSITCSTGSPWTACININSDYVTLDGVTVHGGGIGVSLASRSHIQLHNVTVSGGSNSCITMWDNSSYLVADGIHCTMGNAQQSSYFLIRDTANTCSGNMHDVEVKNSDFHGGSASQGWFGLEIRCASNVSIHDNFFEGGRVLVSLPYVNTARIYNNTFNLVGSAYWGIEIPAANGVTVDHNIFKGDGPTSTDTAVSMNTRSDHPVITQNNGTNLENLVDLGSVGAQVVNNCLPNGLGTGSGQVHYVTEYDQSDSSEVVSGNGPSAC